MTWRADAECAGVPDGIFFPASSARVDKTPDWFWHNARSICAVCPVIADCAEDALKHEEWGFRGGLTPYEAGEASRQIGDSLGIPAGTIRGGLAAVGTVMRHRTARAVTPDDAAAIVAAYVAGETVATIARRHRIGNERTAEIIRATGTPLRKSVHQRGAVPLDPDDVVRLYRAGHTTRQIATRYGACTKRVAAIITAAGAMRPSRGARP